MGYFRFTEARLSWKSSQRPMASAASWSFCEVGIFSVFLPSAIRSEQFNNSSFAGPEHLGHLTARIIQAPQMTNDAHGADSWF
jgi:uncharacterized lipoprotein NlpE involved in copper resistance